VELVAIDAPPVELCVHQPADEVVAVVARRVAPVELRGEPRVTRVERRHPLLGRDRVVVVAAEDRVLELEEPPELRPRDPHDRQEDRRRERLAPLQVRVGLTAIDERVDQLLGALAHTRFEDGHLPRCEHRIEDLAPLGVVGAVELERDGDVAAAEADDLAFLAFEKAHRGPELAHVVRPRQRLDVGHPAQHHHPGC
jgi:hypothetical protein